MKAFITLLAALATLGSPAFADDLSPALGGDTTVDVAGERAFRSIAANATGMSRARFTFGQQLFNTVWEPAPGLQPTTDGLGPLFNRAACSDCHINNGRGRAPETPGDPMESILVRISLYGEGPHGEPFGVPGYGDQLQDRSIDGVPAEGRAQIDWETVPGEYADGTPYALRRPLLNLTELAFGELPRGTRTSVRIAIPLIGLGLLEAIPEQTLHELADPDDENQDGISGRVNIVWDAVNKRKTVGRFGWKANQPSVRQQNAGAAIGDMGLTTPVFPRDNCADGQVTCARVAAGVADSPEIMAAFFDPLVRYTRLVGVPMQRDANTPKVLAGLSMFNAIGCSSCHRTTLVTGDSDLTELAQQTIHPFTDLLLHDLGMGLADHRHDFLANGREWRTPPLWGIGLTPDVSGFEAYLHDGRARTLAEAILWHGGEAERAREAFRSLNETQRDELLTFLQSI